MSLTFPSPFSHDPVALPRRRRRRRGGRVEAGRRPSPPPPPPPGPPGLGLSPRCKEEQEQEEGNEVEEGAVAVGGGTHFWSLLIGMGLSKGRTNLKTSMSHIIVQCPLCHRCSSRGVCGNDPQKNPQTTDPIVVTYELYLLTRSPQVHTDSRVKRKSTPQL